MTTNMTCSGYTDEAKHLQPGADEANDPQNPRSHGGCDGANDCSGNVNTRSLETGMWHILDGVANERVPTIIPNATCSVRVA